jgi:hypothetical protein
MTLACLITMMSFTATAQDSRHREIPLGSEREISVIIDVSFGTLIVEPGERGKLLVADFTPIRGEDNDEFIVKYDVRGDRGELVIRSKDHKRFWKGKEERDIEDRVWRIKLSDAVPVDLRIELGAGKGEFDLSGLKIRSLEISSGASAVEMYCDKPNPISAESITIESGVSSFTATNLANTNFRKLKFSGGVGSYKLDFGGTLRRDADAKIEVGLGAVTINIPHGMNARLLYDDSWFSSFDLENGFRKRRSGVYETEDDGGDALLSLKIESGLGSVKVRRR